MQWQTADFAPPGKKCAAGSPDAVQQGVRLPQKAQDNIGIGLSCPQKRENLQGF